MSHNLVTKASHVPETASSPNNTDQLAQLVDNLGYHRISQESSPATSDRPHTTVVSEL